MVTKEMHDEGITCKGRGFNCDGCGDKNDCIEYERTPFYNMNHEEECEECNGNNDIFRDADGEWILRVENNNWDEYNDCLDFTDLRVDYCPWCGRKLK